jgi:hypothetical protein
MKAVFIETLGFTDWLQEFLPDDVYASLQQELMNDPEKGDVIRGCGGLRKVRVSAPHRGKGKRGGARIIYFFVPEANWFYMLDIYGKDEKDDLTREERKQLSELAAQLRTEAISAIERRTRPGKRTKKS